MRDRSYRFELNSSGTRRGLCHARQPRDRIENSLRACGALAARGYETLTSVQSAVIDEQADGRDLIVSAKTGSGKTVAFGLAIAASCSRPTACRGRASRSAL